MIVANRYSDMQQTTIRNTISNYLIIPLLSKSKNIDKLASNNTYKKQIVFYH